MFYSTSFTHNFAIVGHLSSTMSDSKTVTYGTLFSILTSDTWSYDSESPIRITFNDDGTGNIESFL